MSRRNRPSAIPRWIILPCLAGLVVQSGCTSAITTAYLRDAWWESADHAEESSAVAESPGAAADDDGEPRPSSTGRTDDPQADATRRTAAIEEAVARLSRLGTLDDTARATLIDTLRRTQQEDWPVVIEAFSETLAAAGPAAGQSVPHVVAKAATEVADETVPASAAASPADSAPVALPQAVTPSASPDVAVAGTATSDPLPPEPAPAPADEAAATLATPPAGPAETVPTARPALAVQNVAFASRVRAWGDLDRFPVDRFRPGQELILYFELENLSAGESPAGHTTCIDTVIRLVGPAGEVVHDWSFEPIAETRKNRRRDYFARYLVRIPEGSPAGACRLELTVTDTLAGTSTRTEMPLEVAGE
jgi:hypothetical protein